MTEITPDYVQKVRAYLVQRGELAAQATPGPWFTELERLFTQDSEPDGWACSIRSGYYPRDVINSSWDDDQGLLDAEHIAANDPRTVQADVASLVSVFDRHSHQDAVRGVCGFLCRTCLSSWPCPTVRDLVAPFIELVGEFGRCPRG